MTVLLGSLAAVLFGVGDLVAGVGGRRDGSPSAPVGVAFIASAVGIVLAGAYLLFFSDDALTTDDWGWAIGAAVIMSAARPLLYRGMAVGPIVVFAPVFALVALVVPAVLGALVGQALLALELVGVIVAVPAVVLMSSERRLPTFEEFRTSSVVLNAAAVGAMVGLGGLFLSFVSDGAGAAPALLIAVAGIVVIPLVGRAIGLSLRLNKTTVIYGAIVGCTSITAFVLAAITYQRGTAAIGSALIGLSPGVSIFLAWRFLREKLWPIQLAGAACGAVAVVLFALAT